MYTSVRVMRHSILDWGGPMKRYRHVDGLRPGGVWGVEGKGVVSDEMEVREWLREVSTGLGMGTGFSDRTTGLGSGSASGCGCACRRLC